MPPLAVALALLVGVSLGLLGGGGSILTLPILLYAVGLPPKEAIATSLLVVAGASFVAMVAHARSGRVSLRVAAFFGAASMTTSYLAGRLAHRLPGPWLLGGFTAVMILTGIAMLRSSGARERAAGMPSNTKALLAGTGVGSVTGLVGAGGGFLIVPALTMFAGLDMPRAVGTSLLIITLNSLAGFAGYVGHVHLDMHTALLVTGTAAVGSILGSALAGRVKPAHLRKAFAAFVMLMGLAMAVKQMPAVVLENVLHDARLTHLFAAVVGALMTFLTLHLRARSTRAHSH
jgi:uncharacterized membrane protein YfcA